MPARMARWLLLGVLCLSDPFAMVSQEVTPSKHNETSNSTHPSTNQPPTQFSWSNKVAWVETHKPAVEAVKAAVEIVAYLSALLFFLLKVYGGGYLTANLSINVACSRQKKPHPAGDDYLSVTATVKKGTARTIKLLCGAVRVRELGSGKSSEKSLELNRIDYDRKRILKGDANGIDWAGVRAGYEFLFMPPGDESQFATVLSVKNGEPCQVDVLIFGRSKLLKIKTSQWRASATSLPV
jgi:hypothetical protein